MVPVADHRAEGVGFFKLTTATDGTSTLTRLASPSDAAFLTVRVVADRLKVSRATVYELLGSGRLRHYRVSNAIRISEAALDQFINEAKAR